MGKKAIISKHIVLCTSSVYYPEPTYGIILIEDELIANVILVDSEIPVPALLEKYSEWNPEDYSGYYVSPGLIDLSARMEHEDYSSLTRSAISGGITFLLQEDGIYSDQPPSGILYTDVAKIATIEVSSLESIKAHAENGCFALKGYLFPPSDKVQCIPSNLEAVFEEVKATGLPLFIDPTLPDARMMYLASPLRLQDDRANAPSVNSSKVFAAAFPHTIESEEEDSEHSNDDNEPNSAEKQRSTSDACVKKPHAKFTRSFSNEEKTRDSEYLEVCETLPVINEVKEEPTCRRRIKKYRTENDIYKDLDHRIKLSHQSIEQLSKAEQLTYLGIGRTVTPGSTPTLSPANPQYSGTESAAETVPEDSFEEPNFSPSVYFKRLQSRRPSPLVISRVEPDTSTLYLHHLANYPDQWETIGIKKVYESLKKVPCDVHVTNISSALSFVKLRNTTKKLKAHNITCSVTSEISAAHLVFDSSSIKNGDTRFKNFPPIRSENNKENLVDLLKFKGIDVISSQHAFINNEEKASGNFQKALNGLNTIGFSLQSTWKVINRKELKSSEFEHYIVRLAKWMSYHPAKVLKLRRRGSIDIGKYADLVVWDPYSRENSLEVASESVFSGVETLGRIHKVYLRGSLAFSGEHCYPIGKKVFKIK